MFSRFASKTARMMPGAFRGAAPVARAASTAGRRAAFNAASCAGFAPRLVAAGALTAALAATTMANADDKKVCYYCGRRGLRVCQHGVLC